MKRTAEHNAKIAAALRGRVTARERKPCGRVHAYCGECRPGTAEKIGAAQRGIPRVSQGCPPGCSCLRHRKIDRPWCRKPKPNRKRPPRFTEEHRRSLSKGVGRAWAEGRKVTAGGRPTGIQQKLLVFLKEAGFEGLRMEEPFGRYRVDIYMPSHHLAFEADGEVWHERHPFRDQVARDRRRDAYLLEEHGLPVVRMSEADIGALG